MGRQQSAADPAFDSCNPATGAWSWFIGDLLDGDSANLDFSVLAPPNRVNISSVAAVNSAMFSGTNEYTLGSAVSVIVADLPSNVQPSVYGEPDNAAVTPAAVGVITPEADIDK